MRIFGSLWVFVLSLASVTAEAAQWRLSGSLNYVHPALSERFQVDDSYTLTVEVNDGAQPIGTDRRFFDSVGRFDDAILGGSLEFENDYVMELRAPTGGSFNIVNADSASTSGFDQLNLSFQTFDESLSGDPVAGNDPANLFVSFTDEEAPFDMLKGTDAAFPDFDLPFPNPQTFFLEQSTNERFHLRLQFTGGQPEGTQFVRGSISDFTFVDEADLPGGQAPVENNVVSNLLIVPDGTGRLVLSWDGSGVAPVVVERSGDLLSWEPWVTVPAGAEQEVSIDLQMEAGAWFYRLIASAPEPPDVPEPSIPTPSIPTGSYEVVFDWQITVIEEGERFVSNGATMQARAPEDEKVGDTGQESVRIELEGEEGTIQLSFEDEVLGKAQLVNDLEQGAGYSFEFRIEEDRSPIGGVFYEESTEVIRGSYQPLTGIITMNWEDLNRLSWDIDSRTSLLRTVWSFAGNIGVADDAPIAPDTIANTTLSLTIETSTDESIESGDGDTLIWKADGTFSAGTTDLGTYEYARLDDTTGKIDFTANEDGEQSSGAITLFFTSSSAGTFEVLEGELRETGSFSLEEGADPIILGPAPEIPTGTYDVLFDWEITVAEEGELVVADGATMQATLPEDETLGDVGQETVKIDLDGGRRTIQLSFEDEVFDEAELVHDPQRGGYSFEMRVEEERSPIWGASGFYEESTEVIRGYYQPLTGKITMDWEDLNLLSWDIDSRTSLLRSVWSLSGDIDP